MAILRENRPIKDFAGRREQRALAERLRASSRVEPGGRGGEQVAAGRRSIHGGHGGAAATAAAGDPQGAEPMDRG